MTRDFTFGATDCLVEVRTRGSRSRRDVWQLVSDHPDKQEWPTRRWPDTADVIGEVTWAARTVA